MFRVLILITILFCCFFNVLAQERIEPEEYEVYKAWLEQGFITPETKQIVIMNITDDLRIYSSYIPKEKRKRLSKLKSSTVKDYKLRNQKKLEVKNNFDVNPVVKLISKGEFINFPGSGSAKADFAEDWGTEYRIAFSRVGFNKKKNQALFHVYFQSKSSWMAFGYYFLLLKEDGEWIFKYAVKSWEV